MASFMGFSADAMPAMTGNTQEDLKNLRSYVFQLQESLRYVLANIGAENINDGEYETISEKITAKRIGADRIEIQDGNGKTIGYLSAKGIVPGTSLSLMGRAVTEISAVNNELNLVCGVSANDIVTAISYMQIMPSGIISIICPNGLYVNGQRIA